jgi:hypothetical protein
MNLTDGIGTASWAELVWTGMGLIALWACLGGWRDAILDRRALRLRPSYSPDGPRAVLATGFIRSASVRLLVQTVFFGVGVLSCVTPPPVRPQTANVLLGFIAIVAYTLVECALTYDAIYERQDRRRVADRLYRARADMATAIRAQVEHEHEQEITE